MRQNLASLAREAPTKTLLARESNAQVKPSPVSLSKWGISSLAREASAWVVALQSFESVRLVFDRSSTFFLVAEAIHDHELQHLHFRSFIAFMSAMRRPQALDNCDCLDMFGKTAAYLLTI